MGSQLVSPHPSGLRRLTHFNERAVHVVKDSPALALRTQVEVFLARRSEPRAGDWSLPTAITEHAVVDGHTRAAGLGLGLRLRLKWYIFT